MEEPKREFYRSKRPKPDVVKCVVQSYLQKRNYSIPKVENISIDQHITHTQVDNAVRNTNSILYSCYSSDPLTIDKNFEKFLLWVNQLNKKTPSLYQDLETLVAPLFCHFYLDIIKGGHTEYAIQFFKKHLNSIDYGKCDSFIINLINSIATDSDNNLKEQFRSNKFVVNLSHESINILKKFMEKKCHVVFFHVLQKWFDLQETPEENENITDKLTETGEKDKFYQVDKVIEELNKEPNNILVVNISNTKESVNCAFIKRKCGIMAFNQENSIVLRPIHPYDPILGYADVKEIILADHEKRVNSISISPDFTKLATGSADCSLCIYDLETMTLTHTCTGHIGPIYCTSIGSNGAYVATGSQDTTARLWNLNTGNCLRIFVGHTQEITCLEFHPNCLYLITGSSDHNLRLWTIDDGSPARLFYGLKGVVYAVAFNPKGQIIASVSDDKKIRIWDVLSTKVLIELKHKGEPIKKLAWSECGEHLCAGALDGTIRVWNMASNQDNTEKTFEPYISVCVNSCIYDVEYEFGNFACVTA